MDLQAFNDYYTTEHNRLLTLWRDVVSVKRLFTEVQATTERDLGKLRSDLALTAGEMTTACNSLVHSAAQALKSEVKTTNITTSFNSLYNLTLIFSIVSDFTRYTLHTKYCIFTSLSLLVQLVNLNQLISELIRSQPNLRYL